MDPWIASTNGTRKPFGEAGAGSGQQELWHRTLSGASWNDVLADLFRQADGYLTHPEEEMEKMKAGVTGTGVATEMVTTLIFRCVECAFRQL